MRRLTLILLGALVAGVLLAPPAGAHTERQLHAALAAINAKNAQQTRQINNLTAKLNCLVRYGLSEYLGYAAYLPDGSGGLLDDGELIAANLNVALGDTAAPDVWVVAVRNTATCRGKFGVGANPFSLTATSTAQARMHASRLERLQ
jgi:hypothetical protein